MNHQRRKLLLGAGAIGVSALPGMARANRFPSKNVRILIPVSAGGLLDIIARQFGEKLSRHFGASFVVENRPSAGGIVASQALLTAPNDGHQIMFVSGAHIVTPLLQKLPYDPLTDFSGISLIATSPALVVVRADHPARNLAELISMGKKQPHALSFASGGIGAATHIVGEYFGMAAGMKLLHVPYKSAQEAITETLSGRIDMAFPPIALATSYLQTGRLRALGVTTPKRVPQVNGIPSLAEQGLTNFDYSIPYGAVITSKTPDDIKRTLAEQFKAIGQMPEIVSQLESQGLVMQNLLLGDFDRYSKNEAAKLEPVTASMKKPQGA